MSGKVWLALFLLTVAVGVTFWSQGSKNVEPPVVPVDSPSAAKTAAEPAPGQPPLDGVQPPGSPELVPPASGSAGGPPAAPASPPQLAPGGTGGNTVPPPAPYPGPPGPDGTTPAPGYEGAPPIYPQQAYPSPGYPDGGDFPPPPPAGGSGFDPVPMDEDFAPGMPPVQEEPY